MICIKRFMGMVRPTLMASLTLLTVSAAHAVETVATPAVAAASAAAAPSASGSVFTMLFGLIAVLALMAAIAWLFKRSGLVPGGSNAVAKIIGGVSVGSRERVMVIEVADQWIVVGVAPGRVNTLATMPRQEHAPAAGAAAPGNFSAWLKQTIEKRNGSK